MYAKVGSGIEFELEWMGKIVRLNKEMYIVNCADGVRFIAPAAASGEPIINYENNKSSEAEGNYTGIDPHIWLSLKNAKIMSKNIYEGLVEIDPANKEYYRENLDSFTAELDELDKEIVQMFEDKKNKVIIVFHPNWTYFAADYAIRQIPIEEEGKEPAAGHMKYVIDEALKYNIKTIFASPEFSAKSAEALAREIGGSVVLLSPLEKDYIENMRETAAAFAKAME
jgi:zinc transport system substrate-binding protein